MISSRTHRLMAGSVARSTSSMNLPRRRARSDRSQAQFHVTAGRTAGSVHPAWSARIHKVRQWPRVYGPKSAGLDCGGRTKRAYIAPGSLWENRYCESFNAWFRDEPLNGEICYSLRAAQILIAQWPVHDTTVRPHSALGLSYDFPWLLCDKGAAARHPRYAGQRRGTDQDWVGRPRPPRATLWCDRPRLFS